jgi:hypothetical protein
VPGAPDGGSAVALLQQPKGRESQRPYSWSSPMKSGHGLYPLSGLARIPWGAAALGATAARGRAPEHVRPATAAALNSMSARTGLDGRRGARAQTAVSRPAIPLTRGPQAGFLRRHNTWTTAPDPPLRTECMRHQDLFIGRNIVTTPALAAPAGQQRRDLLPCDEQGHEQRSCLTGVLRELEGAGRPRMRHGRALGRGGGAWAPCAAGPRVQPWGAGAGAARPRAEMGL